MKLTRKNKLLAGIFTTFFSLSCGSFAFAGSVFPDIADHSEHSVAVEYLKLNNIIAGYPDGSFKPDKTINRAEALKIAFLARKLLRGDESISLQKISFPDVKSSDWYYPYVQKAFSLNIVQGYADGYFKPANEITAAESLKIIEKTLVSNFNEPAVSTSPYSDVSTSAWYATYVEYAKSKQLIEGRSDNSYMPERKMSRVEFAEAIFRTVYVEQNKLDKYPLSAGWNSCNNYNSGYKIKYPFTWEKLPAGDQMIFWKKDAPNGQVSFARVYPNSAVIVVARDENSQKLTLEKYLSTLEYGQNSNKQVITLNNMPYASIYIEQTGLQDSYFQMPDGSIVIVYAQVGDGSLSTQLKEEIRYMIGSVRSSSGPENGTENCLSQNTTVNNSPSNSGDSSDLKGQVLKMVLINGKATDALNLLTDEQLFETDSIGIGTGPVDYYFSAAINLTLKIDRNAATILASKDGKTNAF